MSVISKTKNGECRYCHKKNIVLLEYGNVLLKFDTDAFYSFKKCIHEFASQSREGRKLYIKLSQFPIQLSFRKDELLELESILNETEFYLNCMDILNS
jgi:hypothetical protein